MSKRPFNDAAAAAPPPTTTTSLFDVLNDDVIGEVLSATETWQLRLFGTLSREAATRASARVTQMIRDEYKAFYSKAANYASDGPLNIRIHEQLARKYMTSIGVVREIISPVSPSSAWRFNVADVYQIGERLLSQEDDVWNALETMGLFDSPEFEELFDLESESRRALWWGLISAFFGPLTSGRLRSGKLVSIRDLFFAALYGHQRYPHLFLFQHVHKVFLKFVKLIVDLLAVPGAQEVGFAEMFELIAWRNLDTRDEFLGGSLVQTLLDIYVNHYIIKCEPDLDDNRRDFVKVYATALFCPIELALNKKELHVLAKVSTRSSLEETLVELCVMDFLDKNSTLDTLSISDTFFYRRFAHLLVWPSVRALMQVQQIVTTLRRPFTETNIKAALPWPTPEELQKNLPNALRHFVTYYWSAFAAKDEWLEDENETVFAPVDSLEELDERVQNLAENRLARDVVVRPLVEQYFALPSGLSLTQLKHLNVCFFPLLWHHIVGFHSAASQVEALGAYASALDELEPEEADDTAGKRSVRIIDKLPTILALVPGLSEAIVRHVMKNISY